MQEGNVLGAHVQADLANGLQKRQGFDVAHRAAHLDDADVGVSGAGKYRVPDFVGYVRNDLNRGAQVAAAALARDHRVVDAPGGEIGIAARLAAAHEAFIVAKIKVGFGAVRGYEHFAMLKGTHGARIHIEVGIQLDHADGKAAGFENSAQRGCGYALPKRRNYAAGNENVAGHATPTTIMDRASTLTQTGPKKPRDRPRKPPRAGSGFRPCQAAIAGL